MITDFMYFVIENLFLDKFFKKSLDDDDAYTGYFFLL